MANIVGFLKKAFPIISAAASFGGPLGTMAANAVGNALGMNKPPDPTVDSISDAVAGATPDQLVALRQAEDDMKVKLAQLGFQDAETLESLAVQDRESARQRQMSLRDKLPPILAIVITLGFFGVLYLFATHGVAEKARDVMDEMIGTLGTAWVAVVTYYFGSSAGSDRKTELLSQQNSNNT